jgi:hypothetical protein
MGDLDEIGRAQDAAVIGVLRSFKEALGTDIGSQQDFAVLVHAQLHDAGLVRVRGGGRVMVQCLDVHGLLHALKEPKCLCCE